MRGKSGGTAAVGMRIPSSIACSVQRNLDYDRRAATLRQSYLEFTAKQARSCRSIRPAKVTSGDSIELSHVAYIVRCDSGLLHVSRFTQSAAL